MPKRRQHCDWETVAMNGTWSVARNAPFGTSYTPDTARLKIIDGKMVSVDGNYEQKLVNSSPVGTPLPVAQNVSTLPPLASQRRPAVDVPLLSQSHNGETMRQEASAEFMQEDDDGSMDLPRNDNRHNILPPINLKNERSHNVTAPGSSGAKAFHQSTLRQAMSLPDLNAPLTGSEELESLAKRVREELTNLTSNQLKQIYLKLAEVDVHLTGYITFQELENVFRQSRIDVSPGTLRLIASRFLSVGLYRKNLINYEAFVSFIAKSIHEYPESEDRDLTSTGALRRVLEKQLLAGGCCLEYEKIWNFFQRADRSRRDRLSRDQIKRLVVACHLPLSDFVVDQVLNRCSSTSDRYSWQDFLGYIEHVYPMKTSLTIPPTQRRIKEIPNVSSDWPEINTTPRVRITELPVEEELSKLGTVVQETRKRLNEERRDGNFLFKPWFERFMSMAKGLYSFDQTNSGLVNASITRWIIQEYNKAYNLGLDENKVDLVMKPYTEADQVYIEPFLKTLVAQGP